MVVRTTATGAERHDHHLTRPPQSCCDPKSACTSTHTTIHRPPELGGRKGRGRGAHRRVLRPPQAVSHLKQLAHRVAPTGLSVGSTAGLARGEAAAGGGGRGMRVVHNEAALLKAIHVTQTEAKAFFGDGTVYLEKFLENPRHVEIQVIGDGKGEAICLGDRDCSLQRRH